MELKDFLEKTKYIKDGWFSYNQKDKEGEPPEVKDAPKPKPPETDSTSFTKEELAVIGRNEILGYCSGEDQELYFKMANRGQNVIFDL